MPEIITNGTWTSQTLDNSLAQFASGQSNGYWGTLRFKKTLPDDDASVTVDVLDSGGADLQTSITQTDIGGGYFTCDLSFFTNIRSVDIKIKFNLQAIAMSPIISEIDLLWQDTKIL